MPENTPPFGGICRSHGMFVSWHVLLQQKHSPQVPRERQIHIQSLTSWSSPPTLCMSLGTRATCSPRSDCDAGYTGRQFVQVLGVFWIAELPEGCELSNRSFFCMIHDLTGQSRVAEVRQAGHRRVLVDLQPVPVRPRSRQRLGIAVSFECS